MYEPSNAPAPDELLSTAREALKAVLREPDADHSYTILMAMNAMGIAGRAMRAADPTPVDEEMSAWTFRDRVRAAGADELVEPALIDRLQRHVEDKLAVSNPRFRAEQPEERQ